MTRLDEIRARLDGDDDRRFTTNAPSDIRFLLEYSGRNAVAADAYQLALQDLVAAAANLEHAQLTPEQREILAPLWVTLRNASELLEEDVPR